MRFCNSGLASIERCEVTLVSNDGERFEVKLVDSEIARELGRLGVVSSRAMQRNIMVPFSTQTMKYLLGLSEVSGCVEEADWFLLEKSLEEIAGFANQPDFPKIQLIRDAICEHILTTLSDRNCFLLHKKLREFDSQIHADKVYQYILYNLVRMVVIEKFVDVEFYRLPVEDLAELLSSDEINVEDESQIVQVIHQWIIADSMNREMFRPMLMSTVRLLALNEQTVKAFSDFHLSMKPPRRSRDVLMIVGGWLHRQACDRIEWFDPENRCWKVSQKKLPMPLAYHGCVIIDDILYVFGGSNGVRSRCETWKISPKTWSWERCDNMLEPRNYISNSSVVFDGRIYVFGGQNFREISRVAVRSRTGEMYDPKSNRWTSTADLHDMRSDCAAAVYDNQIFVCGGFNGDLLLSSVEVYNPIGDFFSRLVDLPIPITGHCLLNHQEQLYIIGGFNGAERQNKILMWHRNGEWKTVEERLARGRSTSSACSFKNCVVAVGGYTEKVEGSCEVVLSTSTLLNGIPDIIRAKSALRLLVANNWRDHLERLGTMNVQTLDNEEPIDDYQYDPNQSSITPPPV